MADGMARAACLLRRCPKCRCRRRLSIAAQVARLSLLQARARAGSAVAEATLEGRQGLRVAPGLTIQSTGAICGQIRAWTDLLRFPAWRPASMNPPPRSHVCGLAAPAAPQTDTEATRRRADSPGRGMPFLRGGSCGTRVCSGKREAGAAQLTLDLPNRATVAALEVRVLTAMSTRFSVRATNGTALRPASGAALIIGGLLLLISP